MGKRLGFVGIVIDDRTMAAKVNAVLSDYSEIINGRIGVPNHQDGTSVIGLVVEASNEQIGAMTGKLGNLTNVTVRSALTGKTMKEEI